MTRRNDDAAPLDRISLALQQSTRHPNDKKMFLRLLAAAADLLESDASSLDFKIASTSLEEMTRAFDMFAPYRTAPKVTIFGSARITADNPI